MINIPFFTVIIPLFNKEKFIEATLKSVLNQSFQDFEILIIDDCSTDNSLEIVKNSEKVKINIIQHAVNQGLSASRNTGINNSKANFLVFLDADDLMKVNYLEKVKSLIDNFPEAGIFATNYEEVYHENHFVNPSLGLSNFEKDGIVEDFFEVSLQQPIYCQSSLCVRKSVFNTIGLYNTKINYSEDVDFNIRANYHFQLAYSPEKLVQYIMFDENQITRNSIIGKQIPDFDSFEYLTENRKSLKKYLDLNRYMLASNFKKQGDLVTFKKLKNGINKDSKISGLNYKQLILLNLPPFILKIITALKLFFLRKGIRLTSF
ncbi:MAG: glycosyltransferase [Flavobacterium sp.]|nr:glycosyltransferase [Flavobacterium sp.]